MGNAKDISSWFNLAVTQIAQITVEELRGGKLKVEFFFKPGGEKTHVKKIWDKVPTEDRLKVLIQREIYLMYPNTAVMDKPPDY